MMKKITYILIVLIVLTANPLFAQDNHYSLYYAPNLSINPATTGQFNGYYRVHMQYRKQWAAALRNPFISGNFGLEKSYKRFGYGVNISNHKAGVGGYSVTNLVLSGAYQISQDYKKIHNLSTGVQLGFTQKSIDPIKYTYNNQYDQDFEGGGFNPDLESFETFYVETIILPEVNFGIYYYKADDKHWFNPYFGLSGFHLTRPKETFLGETNRIPSRYVSYVGSKITLKDFYHIEPSMMYMRQGNVNNLVFGANLLFEPDRLKSGFYIGPYYRLKDALQIHTGITYGDYIFRFSYDINTSGLKAVTGGKGAFEFSITYSKRKGTYLPSIL
jgi:type IX secretion system PorP/SprF family membrane protein